jgi:tetratricopeptide (TPR) repeat protein
MRTIIVATSFVLLISAWATAQPATLKGSIRNGSGQTVAGAVATLGNPGGPAVLSMKTDAQGLYQFSGLKVGVYQLRIEANGFELRAVEGIALKADEIRVLDLNLTPLSANSQTEPQFYDEPQFTVAGVTDTTNLGTHGADTVARNTESLVRETASMAKGASNKNSFAADRDQLKHLQEAVREAPHSFQANHDLGRFLLDSGDARQAAPYLEEAAALKPTDAEASYALATACVAIGDYEHARKTLRSSLDHQQSADNYRLLADVEEKLGDPVSAVRHYQRAAELQPSEPNLFSWGAELLLHRAFEPASEVFAKGVHRYLDSSRMLLGLGVSLYARGSYEQAIERLCQASDLDPDSPTPYIFLGKIQTIDPAQSREVTDRLARFAKLHPENAQASFLYAVSLWKARRGPEDVESLARIESLLKRAVEIDPKLGEAFLQLGVLFEDQQKVHDALDAYQKAVAASPQLEQAHYRLAQLYRKQGDAEKAKTELQRYDETAKQATAEAERQQREMQGFVYTMRDQTYGAPVKKDTAAQ